MHASLLAGSVRVELLGELVLGGDGFAELGKSVIVILLDVEAVGVFAVVLTSGAASVETHHSEVAIRVRTSADLFEKAVAEERRVRVKIMQEGGCDGNAYLG